MKGYPARLLILFVILFLPSKISLPSVYGENKPASPPSFTKNQPSPPLKSVPRTAIKGSGLPIPRFVMTSARANRVNMRVGPGNNYPVKWVYIKTKVPLKVIAEFGFWRKVQDFDGEEGWIHKSLLASSAQLWIKQDMTPMIADPSDPCSVTLYAGKRVIAVSLKNKKFGYTKVRINDQIGWISTTGLWGILEN